MRHNRSQPPFLRHTPTVYSSNVRQLFEDTSMALPLVVPTQSQIDHHRRRLEESLQGLTASTARKFKKLFENALKENILLLMYSGNRPFDEQWELRKKYLLGGALAARPGGSWHNFGRAVDMVIVDSVTGKALWNASYNRVTELANDIGLKWGGRGDSPHYYNDKGVSLYLLKSQTPGWEQYENAEATMKGKRPIHEDIDYIYRDNLQIGKKIVLWSIGTATVGYVGYKLYKYVHRNN